MSGKVSGWVWDQDLPQNEKYVLLAYADHADHEGRSVFPSIRLIAQKTGYTPRHIKRITRRLENKGYLIKDGEGPKGTNQWMIPLDVGVTPTSPPMTAESGGGDSPVTPGVNPSSPGGDIAESPEPSLNHQLTVINQRGLSQDDWIAALNTIALTRYQRTYRQEVGSFAKYWKPTYFSGEENGRYLITCQLGEHQRAWLDDRGKSTAENVLIGILGRRVQVEFVTA